MPYPPQIVSAPPSSDLSPQDSFPTSFTLAFQPIYDIRTGAILAHEALVRGPAGSDAACVLDQITPENRSGFDRLCRVKAIAMARALDLTTGLSLNCMSEVITDPVACLRSTFIAANHYGFPVDRLIFEFRESDYLRNASHLRSVMDHFRTQGVKTAIDNVGAGFAGLGVLCEIETDIVKLDISLVRGIEGDMRRQRLVRSIVALGQDLDITIVVKGVETEAEFDMLRQLGVVIFQGFYLGLPLREGLRSDAAIQLPVISPIRRPQIGLSA